MIEEHVLTNEWIKFPLFLKRRGAIFITLYFIIRRWAKKLSKFLDNRDKIFTRLQ